MTLTSAQFQSYVVQESFNCHQKSHLV